MLVRLLTLVVLLTLQLVDLSLNCNIFKLTITYQVLKIIELLRKAKAIDIPSYDSLSRKKFTKHLGNQLSLSEVN